MRSRRAFVEGIEPPTYVSGVGGTRLSYGEFEIAYNFNGISGSAQNRIDQYPLPGGAHPERELIPHVPTGAEATVQNAVDALNSIGAKVVGFGAGYSGDSMAEGIIQAFATATGTTSNGASAYLDIPDAGMVNDVAPFANLVNGIVSDFALAKEGTLFEFDAPFAEDSVSVTSHGQILIDGQVVDSVTDMDVDDSNTAYFVRNDGAGPALLSLDLDLVGESLEASELATISFAASDFDNSTDVVTGLAVDPHADGLTFFVSVNHDVGLETANAAVYRAEFNGTLSTPVLLANLTVEPDPSSGALMMQTTAVESLAFNDGTLFATTNDYGNSRVLEIDPATGADTQFTTTIAATHLPSNVAVDPASNRVLVGSLANNVAIKLDEAKRHSNTSLIENLTTEKAIVSLEGLAFSAPSKRLTGGSRDEYIDGSSFDPSRLVDVSAWFETEFHVSSFNDDDSVYQVEATLTALNPGIVRNRLAVGLKNVDGSSIKLSDADVVSPDGIPLQNITRMAQFNIDGFLSGNIVDDVWLSIDNPHRTQFDYEIAVYAELNAAPEFISQPRRLSAASNIVEVALGSEFSYGLFAKDEDFDAFEFSIDAGPSQLVHDYVPPPSVDHDDGDIDVSTTLASSNTVRLDTTGMGEGSYPVTLGVTDVFGAKTQQSFTILVTPSVPNRAPQFEEPYPTTIAYVGQEYRFALNAFDPDGDELTYHLLSDAPGTNSDFEVGGENGVIGWTPQDDDVDQTFQATVRVQDRATGHPELLTSEDFSFNIHVLQQNADPAFTSVPGSTSSPFVVDYEVPAKASGTDLNVDPKEINITLADEQEFVQVVSVKTSALTHKKADVVFVVDQSSGMALELLRSKGLEILSALEYELQQVGFADEIVTDDGGVITTLPAIQYAVVGYDGVADAGAAPFTPACFGPVDVMGTMHEGRLDCGLESDQFFTTDHNALSGSAVTPLDLDDTAFGALVSTSNNFSEGPDPYAAVLGISESSFPYRNQFRDNVQAGEAAAEQFIFVLSSWGRTCYREGDDGCLDIPLDPNNVDAEQDERLRYQLAQNMPAARVFTIAPTPHEVVLEETNDNLPTELSTLFNPAVGQWVRNPPRWTDTGDGPPIREPGFLTSESTGLTESDPVVALFEPDRNISHNNFGAFPFAATFELSAGRDAFTVLSPEFEGNELVRFQVAGFQWGASPELLSAGIPEAFRPVSGSVEKIDGNWQWTLNSETAVGEQFYVSVNGNFNQLLFNVHQIAVGTDGFTFQLFADSDSIYTQTGMNGEFQASDGTSGYYYGIDPTNDQVGVATRVRAGAEHELRVSSFLKGNYPDRFPLGIAPTAANASVNPGDSPFGVWEEFDGPRAIGIGTYGHRQISYLPTGSGGFLSYEFETDEMEPFVGFDDYASSETIGFLFNSASQNGASPSYIDVNSELTELARLTLGASFDIELLLSDSDRNDYIESFAKSFANFATYDETISIVPEGPESATQLFVDDGVYPMNRGPREVDGETWLDFEIKLRGSGRVVDDLNLVFLADSGATLGTIPVSVGGAFEYRAYAADPDGDPITTRLTQQPEEWSEFTALLDSEFQLPMGTGAGIPGAPAVLRFSPNFADFELNPGEIYEYSFGLEVTDGKGGRDEQTWLVRMHTPPNEVNIPPQIVDVGGISTIGTVPTPTFDVAVGRDLSLQVLAVDEDPEDLGRLRYYLTESDEDGNTYDIPAGLRIDRFTGSITWSPGPNDVLDTFNLRVGVHDQRDSHEVNVDVHVTNPTLSNGAPMLLPFDPPFLQNGTFAFTVEATDRENDALTFSVVGLPGAVVETRGSVGHIVWDASDISFLEHKSFRFVVRVTDGRKSDQQNSIAAGWNQNVAPVFVTPPVLRPATVGKTYVTTIRAVDPFSNDDEASYPLPVTFDVQEVRLDGDPQTDLFGFVATVIDGDAMAASGNTLELQGNIPDSASLNGSTLEFDVVATDSDNAQKLQTYRLEIGNSNLNNPPVLVSSNELRIARYENLVHRIDTFDEDGDPVSINVDDVLADIPGTVWDPNTSLLTWAPRLNNIEPGRYAADIILDDGRGDNSLTTIPWGITVTGHDDNRPPSISQATVPDAVVGRTYRYQFQATDPDGDALIWRLVDPSAKSMAIDFETGEFVWTPSFGHLGTQTVDIQVTDRRGASATLPVTINVRAANLPPIIRNFNPPRVITSGGGDYQVDAFDIDAGPSPLLYALENAPSWMSISPTNGLITFMQYDDLAFSGVVTLVVSDGDPNVEQRLTFSVQIDDNAPQTDGPEFLNLPPASVLVGTNGPIFVPMADPSDATLDLVSQQNGFSWNGQDVSWNTTTPGLTPGNVYYLEMTATHNGATSYLRAPILLVSRANANLAPEFQVPGSENISLRAQTNATFEYSVLATDPEGDRISYELINIETDSQPTPNLPINIDNGGKITWDVDSAYFGTSVSFRVKATDEFGSPTESYTIRIDVDNTASLSLSASATDAFPNQRVNFSVGSSNADYFTDVWLKDSDNRLIPLSSDFTGIGSFQSAGTYTVTAFGRTFGSTDIVESAPLTIRVVDENSFAPTLFLYETGATDVRHTIDEQINIHYSVDFPAVYSTEHLGTSDWSLQLVPAAAGPYGDGHVLAEGIGDTNFDGNGIGTVAFDPFRFEEGEYELRLRARAVTPFSGGNDVAFFDTYHSVTIINPSSPANGQSVGNFSLSFTDLSIPVGGIPLTIQRTYDSARADELLDFGHGWRLELRDTQIRTSGTQVYDQHYDGAPSYVPQQTLLRIALPGGEKQSFVFDTTVSGLAQLQRFEPYFRPRPGTTSQLRVVGNPQVAGGETQLSRSLLHPNEVVLVSSADPTVFYNPANLKQHFVLTTADRTEYWIDSVTGQIDKIQDARGNYLEFEDTRVTSFAPGTQSGAGATMTAEVQIRRNGPGDTISSIIDPSGKAIEYDVDLATRDLVGVTNRELEQTTFGYNKTADGGEILATSKPHLLTQIFDDRNVRVLQATFYTDLDSNSTLISGIEDAAGNTADFSYAFDEIIDGTTYSVETVRDAQGYPTDILRDVRGNTVRTIRYEFADGADPRNDDPTTMHQTVYTYDANDFLTGTSTVISKPYGDGSRDLCDSDPECEIVGQWINQSEYDSVGNLNWQIDAAGAQTSYLDYDIFGSPATIVDAAGTQTDNQLHDGKVLPVKSGALLRSVVKDIYGNELSKSSFDYFEYTGQLIRTYNAGETTSVIEYDDAGRVRKTYSAGSGSTIFNYDANGRAYRTFVWVEDIDEQRSTIATEHIYDDEGRVIEIRHFEYDEWNTVLNGRSPTWITKTVFNSLGQVERTTDRFGSETDHVYDIVGNLIETRTPVESDDPAHAGLDLVMVSRTVYDESARAVAVSDPFLMDATAAELDMVTTLEDRRATLTVYDGLGRVARTARFSGIALDLVEDPNAAGFLITELGDEAGLVITDSTTVYRPDGLVNSTTSTIYDETGNFESSQTTWFAYDHALRQTHSVQVVDMNRDGNIPTIAPDFDISVWIDDDTGVLTHPSEEVLVNRTLYDNVGRHEHTIDAAGNMTTFVYDGLGRVNETKVVNPSSHRPR